MIMLLFCCSLMTATPDKGERCPSIDSSKELITCKFLDEFYDYQVTSTTQQASDIQDAIMEDDPDSDSLFLKGPKLLFEPSDGYDFVSTE